MHALAWGFVLFFSLSHAWETDQFTQRQVQLKDSLPILNAKVNSKIRKVLQNQQTECTNYDVVYEIYKEISKNPVFNAFESWINRHSFIDRLTLTEHIYSDAPITGSRGNYFFSLSPTILVDGIRVGTDKFGHYFSEGHEYFKQAIVGGGGDAVAIDYGKFTENTYYGLLVSGVYSNADLVSNYEGYLFYRSLFENGIIEGKKSILISKDGLVKMQREFDFSDHVNEYWDEALIPSLFVSDLQGPVEQKLYQLCEAFILNPKLFIPTQEATLKKRYSKIGLKNAKYNRLDYVCLGGAKNAKKTFQ